MNALPKLSPIGIHRLKQVREQIQKQPHLYNHDDIRMETACGTVCCIMGRLCLNAGLPDHRTTRLNAADLIELPAKDCSDLFFMPSTLVGIETANIAFFSPDPLKRAAAGVKIIDAFIARHS